MVQYNLRSSWRKMDSRYCRKSSPRNSRRCSLSFTISTIKNLCSLKTTKIIIIHFSVHLLRTLAAASAAAVAAPLPHAAR